MNVDVVDESGAGVDVREVTRLSRFTMRRMRLHPATELCVRLVDADTMAVLNQQWMGHEGPTDVLSFPMDELSPGRDDAEAPEGYLGDIALCPEVADRQAAEAGHEPVDELRLLTVHGILHLLGYDHAEPDEHRVMFGLQDRLLEQWRTERAGGDVESLDA